MFKKGKKTKQNTIKSRKELRKEARKSKKVRRHEFYTNRKKPGQFVRNPENSPNIDEKSQIKVKSGIKQNVRKKGNKLLVEEIREKEKRQQVKLQKQMNKQRNKQLVEANLEEDRNIRQLEKQLKLNKRKSKTVPSSFSTDGLDYLLEVCDSDNLQNSALAEQQLAEVNDDFGEDLALMTENPTLNKDNSDEESENDSTDGAVDDELDDFFSDSNSESEIAQKSSPQSKKRSKKNNGNIAKRTRLENSDESDLIFSAEDSTDVDEADEDKTELKQNVDGTWEDIYGRLRASDGTVINANSGKYIPPAARIEVEESPDKQRIQKLERLKKQLKGLLNRLAESNMHTIATQIEQLYMNNSRNDMNNTITKLIMETLVSHVLAPERLLMEHILLVAILHANIGTEVGAHFLQTIVKKFHEHLNITSDNKILDNIVIILAQLYNFKLFDSKLIYEVLEKLAGNFNEKEVECILHILRNVGFTLRKDNPIALKNLILKLQKQASNVSDDLRDNSRVKFMLDILLAIKNNNVSKIPNYDTTLSDHLKKIMKSFIRKGNYITQLNISLEDLLKAEEKGRWWVVGSAWAGNVDDNNKTNQNKEPTNQFSQKLLELARKQRMNTDTRKNIFCIIMSSEDYLDAFEKLLRLALKNQQEREIIHVILHCCLQEKKYNPFYAVLAQKFCEYDRKYQMTIKYSIWDKLKALKEHSASQISNLAKLLSFLFLEKGLPISTLKVVQFGELDKLTLRFIRQILLGILLNPNLEACKGVFENISQSEKLKMFRESLKLFIYHFLLKNIKSQDITDDKKELLQDRVKVIEKLLIGREAKFNI